MAKLTGNKGEFTDYPVSPDALVVRAERMLYYDSKVSTQAKRTSLAGTPDYASRLFAFKTDDGKAVYWLEDVALDDRAAELLDSIRHEYLLIEIGLKPDVRALFHARLLAFGTEAWYNGKPVTTNPLTGELGMYDLATRLVHITEVPE